MAFLADLIVLIPVSGGIELFSDPNAGRYIILRYFFWLLFDLAILLISTLIVTDEHLQLVWKSWVIGKISKRKRYSCPAWFFLLLSLFAGSMMFDIVYWTIHSLSTEQSWLR
jgi:hypothetical protein